MLELIYITQLRKGKQKSLSYAFGLAKAFSSRLFLLPISSIDDPEKGKILIWTPDNDPVSDKATSMDQQMWPSGGLRQKMTLVLFGKSRRQPGVSSVESQLVERITGQGFPLLVLPYDYSFNGIHNLLFIGNAPGFTDHPLKHLIAATFLPAVFKLENQTLKRVHWNNIDQLPATAGILWDTALTEINLGTLPIPIDLLLSPTAKHFQLAPAARSRYREAIFSCSDPILLLPKVVTTSSFPTEKLSLSQF